MRIRALLTLFVAVVAMLIPATAHAAPGSNSAASVRCTMTSSHKCIRGGQFCPRSSYGKAGYDAQGRRYVCKGDRSHPHWMK